MRIGIDVRALMEGKTTGVQVYITNLLHALLKIDQKNEYVLFANSFTPSPTLPPRGRENIKEFPSLDGRGKGRVRGDKAQYKFFRYPNKLFIPAQKFLNFPKLDRLLGGVDLFFSPHWRTTALSAKTPLVVTFHDLSFEVIPEFFTPWKRMWHRFMDYRGAARRADKIIAVSQSTKDDLVNLYKVSPGKIRVIYSGLPPAPAGYHRLVYDTPAKFQNLPAGYFLSFCTFEPRKNLTGVLAAYEAYRHRNKNPRPLVLGGASGWKVKLPKDTVFFKDVNESEKAYLYQNAFALLSLSYYEGFGFPVLEAAARGVPVIASYATSHAEIGKDFALFVNPLRPCQVAQAMLVLEQEPEFYSKLKTQGLKASQGFTWEKTARETLKLFEECALESI